ncbi:hypothetical protein STEG23_012511 [Scotinomys teguina]
MTLLWTESNSPEDSWVVHSGDQLTESPVVMKPSSNEKERIGSTEMVQLIKTLVLAGYLGLISSIHMVTHND